MNITHQYHSYKLYTQYKDNCRDSEWAMDGRHVMILFNLLMSYPFNKVLEIGSHYGCSTTAFVEALKYGCQFEVHLCDISIRNSIKNLCKNYFLENKIKYHEMRSIKYLLGAPIFDFVLLDGSHISEDVEDEFEYLSMKNTQTYLLHDTNTQLLPESSLTPWYDGPLFLMNKLKASPDWLWLEDKHDREGEKTVRGLFFATRNIYLFNYATRIFDYWSKISSNDLKKLLY